MNALFEPLAPFAGRPVLLGLSGGADSVGLLRALLKVGARVTAAHLDHQMRPNSAEDAAWVAALCAELGVPLELGAADVAGIAARRHENVEATARTLRYAFLARAARNRGIGTVLTAHTCGDQAETVLHQLLRGEHALSGIAARRGRVARPWLNVERADIEAWLRELGQSWLSDSSNADLRFTRNWLRAEVLPPLRTHFPALNASLARHAALQREDEELLERLAQNVPLHADLRREPPPVLRRLVAARLRAAGLEFHAGHMSRLSRALGAGETTHVSLPGGREATATGGRLHLGAATWPPPDFPYPDTWTLRHRRDGDRIRLPGGTRKLSDVLTDKKVPRGERGRVWLLAEGAQVRWLGLDPPLWVQGFGEGRSAWHREMGEALLEARQAADEGEVPVGAAVVCGGEVVARAHNTSRAAGDMTRHAELTALRAAAAALGTPYLTNCTLLVTLEPCPMCYGAALEARVGRLVYGAPNPKQGALGGAADLTRSPLGKTPEIVGGVRAHEAARLLSAFFEARRATEPVGAESAGART